MSRKIVATPSTTSTITTAYVSGMQLHHVGVVATSLARADALVGRDRDVAAVERQQRDQVEDADARC